MKDLNINTLDDLYLEAVAAADFSDDKETKVGAILYDVVDDVIEGMATNTFIRADKELPNTRPDKYPFMIHAEQNLICQKAIFGPRFEPSHIVFVTLSPCEQCMRLLFKCGITNIYFVDEYRTFQTQLKTMIDINIKVKKIGKYTKIEMS